MHNCIVFSHQSLYLYWFVIKAGSRLLYKTPFKFKKFEKHSEKQPQKYTPSVLAHTKKHCCVYKSTYIIHSLLLWKLEFLVENTEQRLRKTSSEKSIILLPHAIRYQHSRHLTTCFPLFGSSSFCQFVIILHWNDNTCWHGQSAVSVRVLKRH